MSTSDQHHQQIADLSSGSGQLTRKQMREARLTGSTPIVTQEEAEAAPTRGATSAPQGSSPVAPPAPVVAPAPVVETAPATVSAPVTSGDADEPLTRRQIREQERIRTGALPVHDPSAPVTPAPSAPAQSAVPTVIPERPAAPAPTAAQAEATRDEMITVVPRPAPQSRRRSYEPTAASGASRSAEEQDGVDDSEQAIAPVSVSAVMRAEEETGRRWRPSTAPVSVEAEAAPAVAAPAAPEPVSEHSEVWSALVSESESAGAPAETPVVPAGSGLDPAFGERVLSEQPTSPAAGSFDTLLGDSAGSHHTAPSALIFQQTPAGPSLSGPVASTGEILVTGSYELPAGLGSRGHAEGVADGKEVDAVLVDGELPAVSSPTPIAASAAIGTIKPAGEVIRPPEPEKGSKLMLALTITAGALALALVGALIVAIATGAFSS